MEKIDTGYEQRNWKFQAKLLKMQNRKVAGFKKDINYIKLHYWVISIWSNYRDLEKWKFSWFSTSLRHGDNSDIKMKTPGVTYRK